MTSDVDSSHLLELEEMNVVHVGALETSAGSGPRAPRMWRLTSVRLVRDTSVDHSGRLAGQIGCLCAAHVIQGYVCDCLYELKLKVFSSICGT